MRALPSIRAPRRGARSARSRERGQSLAMFAIVDGDRIPARCFGDALCVASTSARFAKAYAALARTLCRNRQIGLTALALDGEPCVAALVPVGGVLAVTPFRREYAHALADGLRGGGQAPLRRDGRERRAAA